MAWAPSYYIKKRLTDFTVSTIMLIILALSLFPIGWMIFNSFKDNTEILSGRIGLNRASTDIIFLEVDDNAIWVGSADGGLAKYNVATGAQIFRATFKTNATSFASTEKYIWVGSSDLGLFRVPRGRPSETKKFSLDIADVDIAHVSSTHLATDTDKLWFSVEQKRITEIFEIPTDKPGAIRRIPVPGLIGPAQTIAKDRQDSALYVGGDNYVFVVDSITGALEHRSIVGTRSRILKIVPAGRDIFVGTDSGLLVLDKNHPTLGRWLWPADREQNVRVTDVLVEEKQLILGTGRGLAYVPKSGGAAEIVENLFPSSIDRKDTGWYPGEVLALTMTDRGTFIGGTQGRTSFLPKGARVPALAQQVPQGHLLFRWRNYIDLWRNIDFGKYLRNSFIICGITMVIAMILATLAAYALARFPFPGSKLFSMGILATQMIPAIMYLIPIFSMFVIITQVTGIPIKGTFPGVILIYSAFFVPFSIWILRGFFAAIPRELEESARIDGCSPFQVFWHVVLPLAVPGIIATGIYVFLTAWDELMFAWVLTDAHTMTIPVGIRLFVGNYQNRFDLMMAAATVATVPVIILFFPLQRHIVKGLTAGAIKE